MCSTRACRCGDVRSSPAGLRPVHRRLEVRLGHRLPRPGLREKLALLAQHGVLACTGGTLLEVAWQQGVVDEYLDWADGRRLPVRRGVLRRGRA